MKLNTSTQRFLLLYALLLGAGYLGLVAFQEGGKQGRTVIQRALDAHGGEAALRRARIGSAKGHGAKLSVGGFPHPFLWEEDFDRADKLRSTIRGQGPDGVVTQIYLLPANEWWQKPEQGVFERKKGGSQRVEAYLSPLFKLLMVHQEGLVTTRLEDAAVNGSPVAQIQVDSPDWGTVVFSFDLESGRLVKLSKDVDLGDGSRVEMAKVFSQFRTVDGVVVPTRVQELRDGEPDRELVLSEAHFVDKHDPARFTQP